MKKRCFSLFLLFCLFFSINIVANAQSGSVEYSVTFTSNKSMVCKYSNDVIVPYDTIEQAVSSAVSQMQPGDDFTVIIKLYNGYPVDTDWYMYNKVIRSLEEQYAAGGGYTYKLTYQNSNSTLGITTLYDSEEVGGRTSIGDRSGLKEATDALEDYFFVETLKAGHVNPGVVTLHVALDGESQGNDYQNTWAKLYMRFAVEIRENRTVVKTGDETNLLPFYIVMAVSGILFMILGIDGVRQRRAASQREERRG